MRLINADELYAQFTDDNYMTAKATVRGAIKNAPTIDAEPVVHCKDCKYWQDNQEGHYPNEECPWDKGETPDPDDFCSYGERRDIKGESR